MMMTSVRKMLGALTLAGLVAASFSTVAMAEGRGGDRQGAMFDFTAMDANADGQVTKDEVAAFQAGRVAALDTDKDGNLSAAELIAGQTAREKAQDDRRAAHMAARMLERRDANKDGVLSLSEMTLAKGRGDKMFDRADTDNNGAISKAEADVMMEKMAERMDDRGDRDGKHDKKRRGDRDGDRG
jgi:Ca2+-binding EF-hand superfamily protein